MTVMLQCGLDITPVDHASVPGGRARGRVRGGPHRARPARCCCRGVTRRDRSGRGRWVDSDRRAVRLHPRRHREHAARRHRPHVAEPRRPHLGQARGPQPHRIHEGPDRAEDGRGGRGRRRPHARADDPRAHERNTGIALAMVARRKGYALTVVIPDNASEERIGLLRLFGAEIVFSDGAKGTNGSIEVARALAADDRYYMPFQYGNPANPLAHERGDRARDHPRPPRGDALRRRHGHRRHAHRERAGRCTRTIRRSGSSPPSPSSATSSTACGRSTRGSSRRSSIPPRSTGSSW